MITADDPRWLALTLGHRSATPFHQASWVRLLTDCYGFRASAATLLDNEGRIRAGLPFLNVGRGTHKRWVALPFTDRCPILAVEDRACDELVARLDQVRADEKLRTIEVRDRLPDAGWPVYAGYRHVLPLDEDPEKLRKRLHRFRRRALRRAEREGITVSRGQSKSDLCQTFYRLHLLTRHRQGVPVQPRRFFELLWDHVLEPGHGYVLTARLREVPVASSVFLASNGNVIYKFGASDRRYAALGGNTAVMWDAIRRSCEERAHIFDFGRTETGNEGLRAFKLGWGVREEPLEYTVFARKRPAEHGGRALAAVGSMIRHSPPWVAQAIGTLAYRFTA